MSNLNELLERVQAATGPDRELDAAIYNTLIDDGGRTAFRVADWRRGRAPMLDRYHDGWLIGKSEDDIYANNLVRFTASLDAALALVERVLPGAWIDLNGPRKYLNIPTPSPNRWRADCGSVGWGATPALALIAALLSGLGPTSETKGLEQQ